MANPIQRPAFHRGQTMPAYLPTQRHLQSALDGAVASLSFTQGSLEAVRRVVDDATNGSPPLSTAPLSSSQVSLPAVTCTNTPRDARSPPNSQLKMNLDPQPSQYVLSTPLGPGFSSECITIAAKRGSVLVIIADRWDSETDSHFEWKIAFDRDADMTKIQAIFHQGLLKVTVPRIRQY
ncbi:hypothetical protein M408DRAFT_327210 [Serendipita vermifera MAFF 305830]|uniref:SHSP domain-containing protein n=1 Tax=Serendipita vermifera MAFF 305830 TaxID=933852 RepID=A0A0C2X0F1_SERVB|nr:hypothetical protein M408DRAFT_327210 [Serendipita vermifera MAFF 305830]